MLIDNIVKFAIDAHKRNNQARKYTGENYSVHLAEAAGLAAVIHFDYINEVPLHVFLAVIWCHDLIEDTDVKMEDFFPMIDWWRRQDRAQFIQGMEILTDPSDPNMNREDRLKISAEKLLDAPRWIQGLKLCDSYSNIPSIAHHDPSFAKVYLRERTRTIDQIAYKHDVAMAFVRPMLEEVTAKLESQAKCPVCDIGVMVNRLKDIHFVGDSGLIEVIPNIEGSHCTRCAHSVIGGDQTTKRIRKIANKPNSNIRIMN